MSEIICAWCDEPITAESTVEDVGGLSVHLIPCGNALQHWCDADFCLPLLELRQRVRQLEHHMKSLEHVSEPQELYLKKYEDGIAKLEERLERIHEPGNL